MGFSPAAKLIYGVQVPDDGWNEDDTPGVHYRLHECEIQPPESVELVTGGGYDWGHEAPLFLQIAEIANDYGDGGTEVAGIEKWQTLVSLDTHEDCQRFCKKWGIPFDVRVWLVPSYG